MELAIVLFSIAFFGQQSWSTLVMILPADLFPRERGGFGRRAGGLRRRDGRRRLQSGGRLPARSRIRLRDSLRHGEHVARHRLPGDCAQRSPGGAAQTGEDHMKITEIRTRVVEWRGKTVPPQPHFCTNPMDMLDLPSDSMGSFRFHGWLIVEVFTDAGTGGHRQCRALAARHQAGDRSLPEAAADRQGSLRLRISLAAHVPPDHGVRPQGRRHGGDQRRRYRHLGHDGQGREAAGIQAARRPHQARRSRSTPAACTASRSTSWPPRRRTTSSRAIAP